MKRKGNAGLYVLTTFIVFVIVLGALLFFEVDIGKKLNEGIRDMDVRIPGNYCPKDAGVVSYDEFKENVKLATRFALNGKRSCWLKQNINSSDQNPTIGYDEIYDIIIDAKKVYDEDELESCLGQFFDDSHTVQTDRIDLVFWWDNNAVCGGDGFVESVRPKIQDSPGESIDTLYFYSRGGYCMCDDTPRPASGMPTHWYNPPGNSNVIKYSESKGDYNDDLICGEDHLKMPFINDLEAMNDATAIATILSDINQCISGYYTTFAGGYHSKCDRYLACVYTYKFVPKNNLNINDVFPDNHAYCSSGSYNHPYTFSDSACDIRNAAEDDYDYSEFSSGSWDRSSKGKHCIYFVVEDLADSLVKAENEIRNTANEDEHKFLAGHVYEITPFFYFEKDGADDIVIKIKKIQA